MSVSQRYKFVVPARARLFIKQRFPSLVREVAVGLDTLPSFMSAEGWERLWNPSPSQHLLARQMWSGFGERSATELERLKISEPLTRREMASIAWTLAQWYGNKGDYLHALDNLNLMTAAFPRLRRNANTQLMIVECLLQLGRLDDADLWLKWASSGTKNLKAEFYFSAANICHALAKRTGHDGASDAKRLELINKVFEASGFSKIEKRDETAPLTLDNITVRNPRFVDSSAKLSVLVPAYNCADTLAIALTSVLSQTWRNLEVLVVDDCSQDETWSVIQHFAQRDNRIVAIRHEQNGGAYAARNTALARATGDFVTVHDADDWSHPEKFAQQMLHALSNPDGLSTTVGVRVSRDLRFGIKMNTGGMIIENTSSLLLKRQTLVDLGGWDHTRMAADSELYERIKAKHNLADKRLFSRTPLTLILFSGSSLTQTTGAGLATISYGARRQYKEAYRFWHATELARPNPDFRMTPDRRFPAPRILLKRGEPITGLDVLFVGDLARIDRPFESDVVSWETLARTGLKLGVAHWPTYGRAEVDIALPVRSAIATGLVENIVPGEIVACRATVALNTDFLESPPAPLPDIKAVHLFVMSATTIPHDEEQVWKRLFGAAPEALNGDYLTPLLEWWKTNGEKAGRGKALGALRHS